MNAFERRVRAAVIQALRDTGEAPTAAGIAEKIESTQTLVSAALVALADEHRLVSYGS